MENFISNRINMIRATLLFCTNNPSPTSGIPAFVLLKASIDAKMVLIDGLTSIAEATTTGVTLDTIQLRITMTQIALKCGDAVSAYATSVNNNTLRAKVTFSPSQMNKFKKEEIDDICETIYNESNINIASAGAYGYGPTDVTDLATAIGLYRTSTQNPRQAIINRAVAKDTIKTMVRDIVTNLFKKQMDKMVNTLKLTQPAFVSGYFMARIILDLGSTTAKVRGTVTDSDDNNLQGVTFYLTLTGQSTKVAEVTTGSDGKYNIANLTANDYDLYWSKPGYATQSEINVHISAGEEVNRDITLQHLILSGNINAGQIYNAINTSNPAWVPGVTIKIKHTSPASVTNAIHIYPANNPGDAFSGSGSTLLPGQEEIHTITAAEYHPYLNIQNPGPNSGTWEITFL